MTEKSKNKRNDSLKMTLLTAVLAVPGLTVIIFRFIFDRLGGIGGLRFAILLISEIGADMFAALVIMSFYYIFKFTSENPSYMNYSTKSNFKFAKFMIVFAVVCYIIKLLIYILKPGEITFSTIYSLMFTGFGIQLLLCPIVLADNNIYLGASLQTYSIDKIKLDNIDETEHAILINEDYIDLQFHYDEKEVKARIKRTEMTELLEIMKGVGK
jgi:hypothetical protein